MKSVAAKACDEAKKSRRKEWRSNKWRKAGMKSMKRKSAA